MNDSGENLAQRTRSGREVGFFVETFLPTASSSSQFACDRSTFVSFTILNDETQVCYDDTVNNRNFVTCEEWSCCLQRSFLKDSFLSLPLFFVWILSFPPSLHPKVTFYFPETDDAGCCLLLE